MFEDREDAGRKLAIKLEKGIEGEGFVVVGITRGGVVLAKAISYHLKLPLKALVIRKIGAPQNRELAIGALGPMRTVYWDKELVKQFGINKDYKLKAIEEMAQEVARLENILNNKKRLDFENKQAILVDDGVATGATVLCAQKFLQKQGIEKIILATPIISKKTLSNIRRYFDKIVVLKTATDFSAVGQFYREFPQVGDREVKKLL